MKRKIKYIVVSIVTFFLFTITASSPVMNDGTFKFGRALSLIDAFYVDSTDLDALTEKQSWKYLKTLIRIQHTFQQKMLKK